jgi:ABC-type uncharacterized transport system, permease component
MSADMFFGTLELALIYAILALGLYVSFRVLDIPDLTVDGSFVTGAAVSAIMCLNGHPFLGLIVAFIAGGFAGILTSLLHTKLKIQMLLAGILSMLALYSINLKIMGGKPNIPLLNKTTIFTAFENVFVSQYTKVIIIIAILVICIVALFLFLNTKLGLTIRATGNNEYMSRAQGINTNITKTIGLVISNALVALSGAILAQYQSFTDIGMGVGMIVVGLASIMIGEVLFRGKSMFPMLVAVALGSVIYRFIIATALQLGMPPTDLKLISAVIVAIALSIPTVNESIVRRRNRYKAVNNRRSL